VHMESSHAVATGAALLWYMLSYTLGWLLHSNDAAYPVEAGTRPHALQYLSRCCST